MNSDFQEAFEEKCPHIQPVFDYFHIVKNFNEKVVGAVRKDEQKRLNEEGNTKAAAALKRTGYILTSKCSTLQAKDESARKKKGGESYTRQQALRDGGHQAQGRL